MDNPHSGHALIDYRLAFDLAPVGLALSRQRTLVDCYQALCEMLDEAAARSNNPAMRSDPVRWWWMPQW